MEQLPFIHHDLTIQESSTKGRLVTATGPIKCGEVLLKETPYALVPSLLIDEPPFLICSRHECSRRIPRQTSPVQACVYVERCAQRCIPEVVWCGQKCKSLDIQRHEFECFWLKKTSREICSSYGDTEFVLMWLVARMLINRHLQERSQASTLTTQTRSCGSEGQLQDTTHLHEDGPQSTKWLGQHFSRRGWDSVKNLEGDPTFFSPEKTEHWRTMTSNYICNGLLPLKYELNDIVDVICKMELNSFGLYPGVTGQFPVVSSTETRGDYYGGGIYPTAAMFNHSCCPNVTHELDEYGRRIFKAGRDIELGEECCISYFDLAEYPGATARHEAIVASWNFSCDCKRCEEDMEVPAFLQAMDFGI